MPSDAAMKVWREIEEARYAVWKDHGPAETDQAAAAVIDRAIAEAVEQERARIVAWLRGLTDWYPKYPRDIANAIEAGEWK